MRNDWFQFEDLSPRDEEKARGLDVSELEVGMVGGPEDPMLGEVYGLMWEEFGGRGELEELGVLRRRLGWMPVFRSEGYWLRYEMIWVRHRGEIVAVRDHTAIVSEGGRWGAWVHLSHVWVRPEWRRTGLTGWLRAWPVRCARACLREAGRGCGEGVTLLAEMEPPRSGDEASWVRLKAYEKGGFWKVDPARVRYVQPDFRSVAEIEGTGGPKPLGLDLLMRRVGGGEGGILEGRELRAMVSGLYHMYGQGFREEDMRMVWRTLDEYPGEGERVALLPPSGDVGLEGVRG